MTGDGPLRYRDTLHLRLVYEHDGRPLVDVPCTLHCPWSTLEGRADEDGRLRVADLPPGGAEIGLRETTEAD